MKRVKLFEACDFTMGQSPSSESYNAEGRGIPFYQGNADFGKKTPVAKTWCDAPKKIARNGDVLLSVRAPIGAINVASEECCIGRGLAALTPHVEVIDLEYLQHYLRYIRPDLERRGTGSTFKAIGKKVLAELEIPVTSIVVQSEIASMLNQVLAQQDEAQGALNFFDKLVKSRFSWEVAA